MWVFSQRSGNMFHVAPDGTATQLARGYSGNGDGENNPAAQCIADHGPLPCGLYDIGDPADLHAMTYCLPLHPHPENKMCGRSGFWIHDGNFNTPHGMTSEGCICLLRQDRQRMVSANDPLLRVQADDP